MTETELRPVTADDEEFLLELAASTGPDFEALGWTRAEIRPVVELQHRARTADYERRHATAEHCIVTMLGEAVGRLWVDRSADAIHLLDIALLPRVRGQGIATRLLSDLQAEAAGGGVVLRNSVAVDNVRAAALYERLGFVEVARTATDVSLEWRV